ncbi:ABC transporter substrate-binding protein [Arhodomonas aquaeolei]|uniref:substrate-binding domain-containing protein n=1 Tax=Arhodomonas aquaeolei TaxID=2369 RepID=UPI00037E2EFD|nr:ABC transporter substrate-binding protein [Arhodomonas aquaeolei]
MSDDRKKGDAPVNGVNHSASDSDRGNGDGPELGVSRRDFLKGASVAVAGSMIGGGLLMKGVPAIAAPESKTVNIGFIEDLSGNLAVYGLQKYHAAQLAVAEINQGLTLAGGPVGVGGFASTGSQAGEPPKVRLDTASGEVKVAEQGGGDATSGILYGEDDEILVPSGEKGLLGKEVELTAPDGQSNNRLWQQLARKLIQQDKVDVLVAGFSSAEREAIRPIIDRNKQLYFYTNQYEGGVADEFTFCTGAVCEQQVIPVVQYMVENYGPRGFTIAADYNFGQLTAAWVRAYTPLVGGEIVGEEFVPLSVSQFSQVISKVQAAKPDWVMTLLVGQNQSNYYPQAAAAGLEFPMASTINMAQGYEHLRFNKPSLARMHNAINYMPEIPTARNRAFVKRFFEMFPEDPYLGQMAQNTYFSIHLYAKAARLAGTTDQDAVRRVLESGWTIEAPEGPVFLEPGTHHASHYIRMARADENHDISFVRDWPTVEAWWLQRLGVNLVGRPEHKQYTPQEDKFFPMLQKMAAK